MLWIERVLTGFLATICEFCGLDADQLAKHQRRDLPPPSGAGRDTQTIYRIR